MMTNGTSQMTHRVEGTELILERTFNAPRALVFEAFSKPEHLKHWWGPRGWTLPVCNVDFRPGGSWLYCMKCEDERQEGFYGMEAWGKAIYLEIVEPERIVMEDYFADSEGNPVEGMPISISTIEFVEENGKTKLLNRTRYASAEDLQKVLDMGMLQGIGETWDRLDELLVQLRK